MNKLSPFAVLLIISFSLLPTEASFAQAGTLVLKVNAPDDAMAMIEIRSITKPEKVKVVVHQPDDQPHEIGLDVGNYRVIASPLYSEGVRYVPETGPFVVRVKSQSTINYDVTYVASKGVQNLKVTDITETSVSLDWDAELGDDTFVRRVEGDEAAMSPSQGVDIPLTDSSLIDINLKPGTTYTYSIFARPGDGAYGRSVNDPVTITVGTVPDTVVVGVPTFVLGPRTKIFKEGDYLAATPTGTGVRLDFEAGANIPPLGSFISLPISETLQGGYLGEVINVSDDGTSVWLKPAPLGSAFDLYRLHVPSLTGGTTGIASTVPAVEALALNNEGVAIDKPTLSKEQLHKKYRAEANFETLSIGAMDAFVSPQTEALEISDVCDPSIGITLNPNNIDIDPFITHADISWNKYETIVADIPVGFYYVFGLKFNVESDIEIESELALECYLDFHVEPIQFAWGPVPMLFKYSPKLGVKVEGLTGVSNFGFTKTIGFVANGYIGLDILNEYHDKQIVNEKAIITPFGGTTTSSIELKAGGTIEVGPGVGSKDAGVLAGIGGELFIANAGMETLGTCTELHLQSELDIYLTLEAWLSIGELSTKVDLFQGTLPWSGSPWYYPEGCSFSGPEDPTDDVVGEGVVVVDSNLSGLSNQWDKVEGFVPGEKTWVLSTGDIKDVIGAPSYFASTDLGQPGNDELSILSGYNTYDAVTYTATIIPSGNTLHIKYVFASEEYPEYVGSSFNDVMAIFVNGQNCAFVPGTSTPVSINTINQLTNSQYYVDNQYGASGYGSSMDGLTVPLTCSVPVTPGVPVTVKISIADASDHVLDSAVALLDGGIWSD